MTDPASPSLPIDAADWATDLAGPAVPMRGRSRRVGALDTVIDGAVDLAHGRLIALVEEARDALVRQVRGLKGLAASLADSLAPSLGGQIEPLNRAIESAGTTIDSLADSLAEKSVEELVEDGRELVRAQPVVAMGVAIAIGFAAAHYLKAARD